MSVVSYMGTKEALSSEISNTVKNLPSGPLLDLFAGMSAVGRAIADSRSVWVNDVQKFSCLVSEFQFLNGGVRGSIAAIEQKISAEADKRLHELFREFEKDLRLEDSVLVAGDAEKLISFEEDVRSKFDADSFNGDLPREFDARNYRLFADRYASSYFSLRQCIEIDALRYGIDIVLPESESAQMGFRRRALTALGGAVSKCSNSTGHFAQYLTANLKNAIRVASQRKRIISKEWKRNFRSISPVGKSRWRKGNKVFNRDACELLSRINLMTKKPAIIYADPPYTADHYSRYYHILETLVLYDYPITEAKGRYRANRFVSSWSIKTKVESCFTDLIDMSSNIGASLVISYPENGLLTNSEVLIPDMLRRKYSSVCRLNPVAHQHSTMGASKGKQRTSVMEQIFVAS